MNFVSVTGHNLNQNLKGLIHGIVNVSVDAQSFGAKHTIFGGCSVF